MRPAIGPLVLFTATSLEMQAVLAGLGREEAVPQRGETLCVTHKNVDLQLTVTGIGPLCAALAAGRRLACSPTPAALFSLGIAGSYAPGVAPLGSVVVADTELWPEYGLATEDGVDPVALGFPLLGKKGDSNPPPVWNSLNLDPIAAFAALGLPFPANDDPSLPLVICGPSLTVAGASGTPGRARALAARHCALTENMEGFALALAAAEAGLPFIEIRAVSNVVGERGADCWNMPAALAGLSRVVNRIFHGDRLC